MTDTNATAMDEFVQAFRDADGDEARATVLLEAPVSTLLRWRETFLRYAVAVGFAEGIAYLDALSDAVRRRRQRGLIATTRLESAKVDLYGVIEGYRRVASRAVSPAAAGWPSGGAPETSGGRQSAARPSAGEGVDG